MVDLRQLLVTVILTNFLLTFFSVVFEVVLVLIFFSLANVFVAILIRVVLRFILLVLDGLLVEILEIRVLLAVASLISPLLLPVLAVLLGVARCLLCKKEVGELVHGTHIFDFDFAFRDPQFLSFLLNSWGLIAHSVPVLSPLAALSSSTLRMVTVRGPSVVRCHRVKVVLNDA